MVVAIGVYTTKYGIRKQKFVNVQKVTVQLLTESASNATIELHSGTPNENGALVFKDIIKNFLQQPVWNVMALFKYGREKEDNVCVNKDIKD